MGKIKQSLILGVISLADFKFHTNMKKWYGTIRQMEKWDPSRIRQWQEQKLRNLVNTAYSHSRYYRELFDSHNINPADIKTIEDLERIPVLTKDIIRERFDDILLDNKSSFHYNESATGGSSGIPLHYVRDNNSWGFGNAYQTIMWQKTGYCYGDKFLALGASSILPENKKSRLHNLFYGLKNKIPFSTVVVSDERFAECVDLIRKKNIHYIYGFSTSLYLLAKYVIKNNLQDQLDIRACFPTSEIFSDVYYDTVYEAFKSHIMNSYGANDGGIKGFRLDREEYFKVGYNCLVQIEETVKDSRLGPAIITDLTNTVFPFIRYEIGDVVKLARGYNSFYNGQLLEEVIGRQSDLIQLENGCVLTCPSFAHLIKDLHVEGYRLYKLSPMEITFEIVKGKGYTNQDEAIIIDAVHRHTGEECKVRFVYTDHLKTRENGKMFYLQL